jgi:hypothetical protein
MERKIEHQKLCKKAKCRNIFNRGFDFGRYHSQAVSSTVKTSIKPGVEPALVPDGPDCKWVGGEYRRIEAKNRAALEAHFAKLKTAEEAEIEANGYFTDTEWREVISPDGVRCYVMRWTYAAQQQIIPQLLDLSDDLSIPDFLRRSY